MGAKTKLYSSKPSTQKDSSRIKGRSQSSRSLDNKTIFSTIKGLPVVAHNPNLENQMNISTDIKPISYLKSKSADLLKQVNETHRPVIITQNGEPKAVLQDPESYENMRNALGILKLIAQGEEDLKKKRVKSQEDVFSRLEARLDKSK